MKILTGTRVTYALCGLLASLAALACGDASKELLTPAPSTRSTAAQRHYRPTLPGEVVIEIPAPYNPALDGPLVRYLPTKAQHAADAAIKAQRWSRGGPHQAGPTEAPRPDETHNNEGKTVNYGAQTAAGIYAVNDQGLDIDIPVGSVTAASRTVTVYAPTHLSAGGACIEASTTHYRASGDVTRHYQGFWDWCTDRGIPGVNNNGTGWSVTYEMGGQNDSFTPNFVRTLSTGKPSMLVQVYSLTPPSSTGGCWVGIMFNCTTTQWQDMTGPICGSNRTGAGITGWTMYEDYNLDFSCPALPGVRASSIVTLGSNGTWYGSTLSAWPNLQFGASCFAKGAYTFTAPSSDGGNAWHAYTPGS